MSFFIFRGRLYNKTIPQNKRSINVFASRLWTVYFSYTYQIPLDSLILNLLYENSTLCNNIPRYVALCNPTLRIIVDYVYDVYFLPLPFPVALTYPAFTNLFKISTVFVFPNPVSSIIDELGRLLFFSN